MLKRTFSHIEGVSENFEKKIWSENILSWDDFLEKYEKIDFISIQKKEKIRDLILESKKNLENNNIDFFKNRLKKNQHWRLFKYFKVLYLDIETTGLSKWVDEITLLGTYDKEKHNFFINGENLQDAIDHINQYDIIVSFNGKQFDVPFIEYHFKTKFDHAHLDLRFLLKEFGFQGGLKKIEKEFKISRENEVKDMDGREAIRLWNRYKRYNDQESLKKLLKYNLEDTKNLQKLINWYIEEKEKQIFLNLNN